MQNRAMPNVAAVLKAEITRIARRELRARATPLAKTAASLRSEVAQLKRRIQDLERSLRQIAQRRDAPNPPESMAQTTTRFSRKSLAAQRRRLGLSAADCGLLIGASSQSIYNWQDGKTRPQARHMAALAALRTLSRKDANLIVEARRRR